MKISAFAMTKCVIDAVSQEDANKIWCFKAGITDELTQEELMIQWGGLTALEERKGLAGRVPGLIYRSGDGSLQCLVDPVSNVAGMVDDAEAFLASSSKSVLHPSVVSYHSKSLGSDPIGLLPVIDGNRANLSVFKSCDEAFGTEILGGTVEVPEYLESREWNYSVGRCAMLMPVLDLASIRVGAKGAEALESLSSVPALQCWWAAQEINAGKATPKIIGDAVKNAGGKGNKYMYCKGLKKLGNNICEPVLSLTVTSMGEDDANATLVVQKHKGLACLYTEQYLQLNPSVRARYWVAELQNYKETVTLPVGFEGRLSNHIFEDGNIHAAISRGMSTAIVSTSTGVVLDPSHSLDQVDIAGYETQSFDVSEVMKDLMILSKTTSDQVLANRLVEELDAFASGPTIAGTCLVGVTFGDSLATKPFSNAFLHGNWAAPQWKSPDGMLSLESFCNVPPGAALNGDKTNRISCRSFDSLVSAWKRLGVALRFSSAVGEDGKIPIVCSAIEEAIRFMEGPGSAEWKDGRRANEEFLVHKLVSATDNLLYEMGTVARNRASIDETLSGAKVSVDKFVKASKASKVLLDQLKFEDASEDVCVSPRPKKRRRIVGF